MFIARKSGQVSKISRSASVLLIAVLGACAYNWDFPATPAVEVAPANVPTFTIPRAPEWLRTCDVPSAMVGDDAVVAYLQAIKASQQCKQKVEAWNIWHTKIRDVLKANQAE